MNKCFEKITPRVVQQWLQSFNIRRQLTSSEAAADAVGQIDARWRLRIDDVLSSPDNAKIPRCLNAGKLDGYTITMHNEVKVCANGYYGSGILNMLIENKGVHEPQEEYAFEKIIRLLPEQCTMLELGAYWGFYSLSLLKQRPMANCFLVEPDSKNLLSGKLNFQINRRKGHFTLARVDQGPQESPKTISVDSFCAEQKISHLNILHADIQRAEFKMIEGANRMLSDGHVDFIFISTHTDDLHINCIEKLKMLRYDILADVNLAETFSYDGLIVAKHHTISQPERIELSKKLV